MSIEHCKHCGHPRTGTKEIIYRVSYERTTTCKGDEDEYCFLEERDEMDILKHDELVGEPSFEILKLEFIPDEVDDSFLYD